MHQGIRRGRLRCDMTVAERWPSTRRWRFGRVGAARRTILAFATIVGVIGARSASIDAQPARTIPVSLSSREFWDFFISMSEPSGFFASENFVSNEETYQSVI